MFYLRLLQSGKRDSNPQHSAWKADALPIELFPRKIVKIKLKKYLRRDLNPHVLMDTGF